MTNFHLVVFEAEEGGYWARVAELPGCVAQGESIDGLVKNAKDAIETFLEVMGEEGQEPTRDKFIAVEVASV